MSLMRFLAAAASVAIAALGAGTLAAQSFPSKPVRIVTAEPAGGLDFVARLIAQGLTPNLGQQVIVENRGGAGGIIAGQTVAKSAADGYTLLLYGSNIWLLQFMQDNVPYDAQRDFLPVTLAVTAPNILVVHPTLPVKSPKDLIALAKARPGQLTYASNSVGSSPYLAAQLFKSMADVNMLSVPYKGGGQALTDLVGGQIQFMFATPGSVAAHIKSGRVRALAITSAQPSAVYPGLPTVAASGLPGYKSGATYIIFAPAGTPAAVIHRLNQEIVQVLHKPDVKDKFLSAGIETVGSTEEEAAAAIKSEVARMGKVLKDAHTRGEQ